MIYWQYTQSNNSLTIVFPNKIKSMKVVTCDASAHGSLLFFTFVPLGPWAPNAPSFPCSPLQKIIIIITVVSNTFLLSLGTH